MVTPTTLVLLSLREGPLGPAGVRACVTRKTDGGLSVSDGGIHNALGSLKASGLVTREEQRGEVVWRLTPRGEEQAEKDLRVLRLLVESRRREANVVRAWPDG